MTTAGARDAIRKRRKRGARRSKRSRRSGRERNRPAATRARDDGRTSRRARSASSPTHLSGRSLVTPLRSRRTAIACVGRGALRGQTRRSLSRSARRLAASTIRRCHYRVVVIPDCALDRARRRISDTHRAGLRKSGWRPKRGLRTPVPGSYRLVTGRRR